MHQDSLHIKVEELKSEFSFEEADVQVDLLLPPVSLPPSGLPVPWAAVPPSPALSAIKNHRRSLPEPRATSLVSQTRIAFVNDKQIHWGAVRTLPLYFCVPLPSWR